MPEPGRYARLESRLARLAQLLAEPGTLAAAHDVPNFLFIYGPEDELLLRDALPGFVTALAAAGREAILMSLAEVLWSLLEAGGWPARLAAAEPASGLSAINDTVAQLLLPQGQDSIESAVRRRIQALSAGPDGDRPRLVVLHRTGALFPVHRASALLARLEGLDIPVMLCFPGSDEGRGPRFLGRLAGDPHYRAQVLRPNDPDAQGPAGPEGGWAR